MHYLFALSVHLFNKNMKVSKYQIHQISKVFKYFISNRIFLNKVLEESLYLIKFRLSFFTLLIIFQDSIKTLFFE